MATATIQEKTIVVPMEVTDKVVTLELTMREAEVLKEIARSVIGPVSGSRGDTDRVYWALDSAGVADMPRGSSRGTVDFNS